MSILASGDLSTNLSQKKVIITAALTGALANRRQCPVIPYTPLEIAAEAKSAYDAGASIVHIHAREDDGRPSWRTEQFIKIREQTAKLCPVLINFSTGGVDCPILERISNLSVSRPEIAALNMGSMNYAIYSQKSKSFLLDEVFANPFKDIVTALQCMNKNQIIPELECFDLGHIANSEPLIDMGLLRLPLHWSFILGVTGGISTSAKNLKFMSESVPQGSLWQTIGISRDQWWLCEEAIKSGGNIRVGLEDNFYLPDGVTMARGNGELVNAAVKLVERLGYQVSNLTETKRAFGL